ncbi:MAG TPA: T9SS type A sorting domain-containing protein [Bacteroidia bacterium]|nr:T9SS type A sorting domain-containing protein [Bacteroidia bacterium]
MKQSLTRLIALLLFSIAAYPAQSQTIVGGGIFSSTTWTLSGSPYILTSNVVIFPGVTLNIQPGVVVQLGNSMNIDARGDIYAIGTATDSILFTSSMAAPYPGCWGSINIDNTQGSTASFSHCVFEFASTAVGNTCCFGGGPLTLTSCSFNHNYVAVGGYSGYQVQINYCYFSYNFAAITAADKVIRNSVFVKNNYGLYATERVHVYDSDFCGNGCALYGGRGDLQNNSIMNNSCGVVSFYEGFSNVTGNVIYNNDTGMVLTTEGIGSNNTICGNHTYNIIHTGNVTIGMEYNCWCTTDQAEIAGGIYDAYDNINLGIADFSPELQCDSTVIPFLHCDGTVGFADFYPQNAGVTLYPNPMTDVCTIRSEEFLSDVTIVVTDVLGAVVQEQKQLNGTKFEIARGTLSSGIYFVQVLEAGKPVTSLKLVIADH